MTPAYRIAGTPPSFISGTREITASAKNFFSSETVISGGGIVAGLLIGEWVGNKVAGWVNITEGWSGVAVKGISKALLGFLIFVLGRKVGGFGKIFTDGAAIACIASVILDVVAQTGVLSAFAARTVRQTRRSAPVSKPTQIARPQNAVVIDSSRL